MKFLNSKYFVVLCAVLFAVPASAEIIWCKRTNGSVFNHNPAHVGGKGCEHYRSGVVQVSAAENACMNGKHRVGTAVNLTAAQWSSDACSKVGQGERQVLASPVADPVATACAGAPEGKRDQCKTTCAGKTGQDLSSCVAGLANPVVPAADPVATACASAPEGKRDQCKTTCAGKTGQDLSSCVAGLSTSPSVAPNVCVTVPEPVKADCIAECKDKPYTQRDTCEQGVLAKYWELEASKLCTQTIGSAPDKESKIPQCTAQCKTHRKAEDISKCTEQFMSKEADQTDERLAAICQQVTDPAKKTACNKCIDQGVDEDNDGDIDNGGKVIECGLAQLPKELKYIGGGGSGTFSKDEICVGGLPEFKTCSDQEAASLCVSHQVADGVEIKIYPELSGVVNFESPASCAAFFSPQGGQAQQASAEGAPSEAQKLEKAKFNDDNAKRVIGSIFASDEKCDPKVLSAEVPPPTNAADKERYKAQLQEKYDQCVTSAFTQHARAVYVGVGKCAAVQAAAAGTTQFEEGERKTGDPSCKYNDGLVFDYPSCVSFRNWYTGMKAGEVGFNTFNEADKVMDQTRAQEKINQEIAKGNGQAAGFDATKAGHQSAAEAATRLSVFHTGQSTAMWGSLATYNSPGNIDNECGGSNKSCCKLFDTDKKQDRIQSISRYFQNQKVKDFIRAQAIDSSAKMISEIMKAVEFRRLARQVQEIKDKIAIPNDNASGEGIMKYCQLNPQDPRCVERGPARMLGGLNLSSSVGAQDFGILDSAAAGSQDLDTSMGGTNAVAPGDKKQVAGIGTMAKDAAAARNMFNAPAAARGGGGGGGGGGGAGGASASASANGLSNDPGAEDAGAKEASIKVTSKSATYEGGAGYNGGGWRAGSGKKEESVTANPFASLFDKDKGRNPASTPEIDSSHSDLFTKISNRYGEVQKRKALMEAR